MIDLNYVLTLVVILIVFAMWSGKDRIARKLVDIIRNLFK